LDVCWFQRQQVDVGPEQTCGEHRAEGGRQRQLADSVLEGDFQQADRGDPTDISWIENRQAGERGQLRVVGQKPQQYMGVEQEAHSLYSRSSSRGSLKSSGTMSRPSYS